VDVRYCYDVQYEISLMHRYWVLYCATEQRTRFLQVRDKTGTCTRQTKKSIEATAVGMTLTCRVWIMRCPPRVSPVSDCDDTVGEANSRTKVRPPNNHLGKWHTDFSTVCIISR
jgi:hypothetical protein